MKPFCDYPSVPRSTLLHIIEKLIGGATLDLQKRHEKKNMKKLVNLNISPKCMFKITVNMTKS
jgi:hypothetical protein